MDAECNIHICQVGQMGFFDKYYENLNIPVLPHQVNRTAGHQAAA